MYYKRLLTDDCNFFCIQQIFYWKFFPKIVIFRPTSRVSRSGTKKNQYYPTTIYSFSGGKKETRMDQFIEFLKEVNIAQIFIIFLGFGCFIIV